MKYQSTASLTAYPIPIEKVKNGYDYIIRGTELYNYEDFSIEGIDLKFLRTNDYKYKQPTKEFVPGLSFIDVLMNNDIESVQELLGCYELIQG